MWRELEDHDSNNEVTIPMARASMSFVDSLIASSPTNRLMRDRFFKRPAASAAPVTELQPGQLSPAPEGAWHMDNVEIANPR